MHFRYRVRMHPITDIQNIHRNMRTDADTWDKTVTLLYNLVLQQWSCGRERLLTICPSEIDAKDRPPRPYLKTKVLHKWRNISCQKYTVVSILLASERTRDKYSCCLSLPSAAQWKTSFSIACQIWSRPYWRWVVFKCVTANNCVFCGTASDAADLDPPVNRHSGFWHQNRTQPRMEHSIRLNYLQRLELNALCMFQGLMEEVISWAICVNVGKLQRPFLDHCCANDTHSIQVKRKTGGYLLLLIKNYNPVGCFFFQLRFHQDFFALTDSL